MLDKHIFKINFTQLSNKVSILDKVFEFFTPMLCKPPAKQDTP